MTVTIFSTPGFFEVVTGHRCPLAIDLEGGQVTARPLNGIASSGHPIVVDGDKAADNGPMDLVLIGLCGCTGYDVVSILQKKREPFTSLEVRAEAERAADPPSVYTDIRLI